MADETIAEGAQKAIIYPSGNYDFDYIEQILHPLYNLIRAWNVKSTDNSVILGSAGRFSFEGAAKLKVGNAVFNDIGQSVFVIEDNELKYANIISAIDNNTSVGVNN